MKATFGVSFFLGALVAVLVSARDARAASVDAGARVDAGPEAGAVGQAADSGASADEESPFACNKALCATDPGDTACSIASRFGDERAALSVSVSASLAGIGIGLGAVRRRARREKERTR